MGAAAPRGEDTATGTRGNDKSPCGDGDVEVDGTRGALEDLRAPIASLTAVWTAVWTASRSSSFSACCTASLTTVLSSKNES